MGEILAYLVPRCSDPCIDLRAQAIEGIQIALKVALLYEGKLWSYIGSFVKLESTVNSA